MYPFTLLDNYNASQDQRLLITKFSKGNKHRISLRVESKGALRSKIHEQLKTENSSVPYLFSVYFVFDFLLCPCSNLQYIYKLYEKG